MTTITFRVDELVKKNANEVFERLGMNMSEALVLFLYQTIIQNKYPCSLDSAAVKNAIGTYPPGFFSLFGAGKDDDMEIPSDSPVQEVMSL